MRKMSLRNIIDSQKENIRQKICTAISEIWHRETGSILPLYVEGTVCITPSPGQTTSFQISSQVPGKFPVLEEVCDDAFEVTTKRRKIDESDERSSYKSFSSDDENSTLLRQIKPTFVCDSNNNHSEIVNAEVQPSDFEGLPPDDGTNETSDLELESSDAELSTDITELSHNSNGKEMEKREDGTNNDSGVHDLSTMEGNVGSGLHAKVDSISPLKTKDSEEGPEWSVGKETDENRLTPPPLVIDLKSSESNQPILSLMYNSANVQTAIRNMLSSKLVTTSVCKISNGKADSNMIHLKPVSTTNSMTPQVIFQKTVQTDECGKISARATQNFSNHSAPISFVYPISGKQFVQQPLQGIVGIANQMPGGDISMKTTKLEIPLNVSLQSADSTIVSSAVKSEPGIDQSTNNIEQKYFRCEYCQKTFLFKSKYQEHLPVHTTERPFECNVCQRTYKYKYDLNVHQRTHQGIPTKSTVCPKCNHRFPTNKLLRVHINETHRDDENITEVKPKEMHDVSIDREKNTIDETRD